MNQSNNCICNGACKKLVCDGCGHYKCKSVDSVECSTCVQDSESHVIKIVNLKDKFDANIPKAIINMEEKMVQTIANSMTSCAELENQPVSTNLSTLIKSNIMQYNLASRINRRSEENISSSENTKNVFHVKKIESAETIPDEANTEQNSIFHTLICDLCKRNFVKKSQLIRHMLCHMKIKPYKCNMCEANFSNSYTLKRHVLIHSNEKPYTCKICKKSFRDASNFKKHRLRHSNIRFSCSECGKCFRRKSYLKSHMKIHSKSKTWICSICSITFYTKKDMIRHETTHSGQKQYCCTLCDANFNRKDNLDRHIRNSHIAVKHQEDSKNDKSLPQIMKLEKHTFEETVNDYDKNLENTCKFQSVLSSKLCVDNCLLHPKENSVNTQISDTPESLLQRSKISNGKEENENIWLKILEENNKRESVIFKSNINHEKNSSKDKISKNHLINVNLTEHNEINFSNNMNLNFTTEQALDIQDNVISSQNPEKVSTQVSKEPFRNKQPNEITRTCTETQSQNDEEYVDSSISNIALKKERINTDFTKNDDDIVRAAYYGHKRKYIDFKNKLKKPVDTKSKKFHEFDDAKASLCIYQLSSKINNFNYPVPPKNHYPPESIELYKKILIPKYRSKEPSDTVINLKFQQNEAVSEKPSHSDVIETQQASPVLHTLNTLKEVSEKVDVNAQNHSDSDVQISASSDIHWRRRLAQISNCEKQVLEK